MRDSQPTEDIGDQTVANRGSGSEGAMFGSVIGRKRRSLWAILSLLFALGFAVSAILAHSERNAALDSVAERARERSQLATAGLTRKQLTKPITGSSYDRVAGKIRRSVSSEGSVAGVTIWSPRGRILFSFKKSLVGSTPPEMRSLITGIADGSGSTRVLGGTVQTFTPVSKGADGAVAIVEVDQPFAEVEAQTGDLSSTLRLVSAVGLVVSLLFLGLTFVSSKGPVRAREDTEPARLDEREEGDEGAETKAREQEPDGHPAEQRVPTYAELFGLRSDLDAGVPAGAPVDKDIPGGEGTLLEADGQPSAEPSQSEPVSVEELPVEELPVEESSPTSEEDVQALHADLDEAVDQVEAPDAGGESEESIGGEWPEEFRDVFQDMARGGDAQTQEMRQRREEFKTRAKQAELRLKQLDAEHHDAPSAPSSKR
jgi:hypothetical protein